MHTTNKGTRDTLGKALRFRGFWKLPPLLLQDAQGPLFLPQVTEVSAALVLLIRFCQATAAGKSLGGAPPSHCQAGATQHFHAVSLKTVQQTTKAVMLSNLPSLTSVFENAYPGFDCWETWTEVGRSQCYPSVGTQTGGWRASPASLLLTSNMHDLFHT